MLYEHVPANLDTRLLGDSTDDSISYETFARNVANAALASQRLWEERQEDREKRQTRRPPRRSERQYHKKEAKWAEGATKTNKVSEEEQENLRKEGQCFLCRKEGHIARNCPQKLK